MDSRRADGISHLPYPKSIYNYELKSKPILSLTKGTLYFGRKKEISNEIKVSVVMELV
jgi:hypothetical protein